MDNIGKIEGLINSILQATRVPGVAVAVVANGETKFACGFGLRDLDARLPMGSRTAYPIASTTKAMTATLLGMLVDEGKLAWDTPVRNYLPGFELFDPSASRQVSLRDLMTMRTGLPRHDWMWLGRPIARTDVVAALRHLEPAAGFRERFQYNNIGVTTAGHVAEVVAGSSWEELVRRRLFEPLGMTSSSFARPVSGEVTESYIENSQRHLKPTLCLTTDSTGPSGGTIYSTIEDMAKWMIFNLDEGKVAGNQLIKASTLAQIHSAQVMTGADPSAPTPNAGYAMGWFIDTYNGFRRASHGGYLNDVNGDVMLIPGERLGVVCFSNFGPPGVARLINEHTFDLLTGRQPVQSIDEKLSLYEKRIKENTERLVAVRRVAGTSPSHELGDYVGKYRHPGYGPIKIDLDEVGLIMTRGELTLPLEHWHYDAWVVRQRDLFVIHAPHPFDVASRWMFQSDADGMINCLLVQLESAMPPIRFTREPGGRS